MTVVIDHSADLEDLGVDSMKAIVIMNYDYAEILIHANNKETKEK